jgi:Protein of unknown function (DUF1425)
VKPSLVLTILSCALALAPIKAGAEPVPPAATEGIASKMIVRGDLNGLQVVDLRSQVRNEVIVVQAEVYNFFQSDARLFYRFRWIDAGGMQVGDGEVWKPLVFLGRQTQYLKGTAPGPKASDFFVEMSAEPR